MKIENTQAQMRKGVLEYCILAVIARGPSYASDILQELKQVRLVVVEGTLYPLLTRLKNAGLLEYRWVESQSGPPRKYYHLTDEGAQFMLQLGQTWSELRHAVDYLTQNRNSYEQNG
jgi:PadR family transcriptional regulator PadR